MRDDCQCVYRLRDAYTNTTFAHRSYPRKADGSYLLNIGASRHVHHQIHVYLHAGKQPGHKSRAFQYIYLDICEFDSWSSLGTFTHRAAGIVWLNNSSTYSNGMQTIRVSSNKSSAFQRSWTNVSLVGTRDNYKYILMTLQSWNKHVFMRCVISGKHIHWWRHTPGGTSPKTMRVNYAINKFTNFTSRYCVTRGSIANARHSLRTDTRLVGIPIHVINIAWYTSSVWLKSTKILSYNRRPGMGEG